MQPLTSKVNVTRAVVDPKIPPLPLLVPDTLELFIQESIVTVPVPPVPLAA